MDRQEQHRQKVQHLQTLEVERKKLRAEQESANQLKAQTSKQTEMVMATFEMVEQQRQANELQKESNQLLKEQIDYLKEENKLQAKALKRERAWNIVAWVFTSLIAIAAIIVPILVNK